MTPVWTSSDALSLSNGEAVTLVEGSTFCLSDVKGDLAADAPLGLFFRDTRIISTWLLLLDGEPLLPVAHDVTEPFSATFLARGSPRGGRADSTVLVVRRRVVGQGMRESLRVRNLGRRPATLELTLEVGADFADLFAVKENRVEAAGVGGVADVGSGLVRFDLDVEGRRGVVVRAADAVAAQPGRITWRFGVDPHQEWSAQVRVSPTVGGEEVVPRVNGSGEGKTLASTYHEWRRRSTVVTSAAPDLDRTFVRSVEDLGALRIFDPDHPRRTVVAAGAPWFMALFGRDSLLTSWMLLPVDRDLALGTLSSLAERQGRATDAVAEEQPGRILHEVRFGTEAPLLLGGRNVYYGSIDATPLFVMLLGELRRWGAAWEDVAPLLPAADRALDWVTRYGDRDGDGFVEYERMNPRGLLNQGWKDSWDAITFADGERARGPIALAEVQGYTYAAFRARAALARDEGDQHRAQCWDDAADALSHRFNEAFWLREKGRYALALDGNKRPVDALASNVGHCLWTGIVAQEHAAAVAEQLLSPEMFSGWGIRTLASTCGAYNPMSYHNGSVWPHDNAILAAGLARYGFTDEASRVVSAQLDAAALFGGRLPELFCGFDRSEFPRPVPYPAACSPQAWAAAAPFLMLRAMLRLEPDLPGGVVRLDPGVPDRYLPLTVENVLLGDRRVSVHVAPGGQVAVEGLGEVVPEVPQLRS